MVLEIISGFEEIVISHILRNLNVVANGLATYASRSDHYDMDNRPDC